MKNCAGASWRRLERHPTPSLVRALTAVMWLAGTNLGALKESVGCLDFLGKLWEEMTTVDDRAFVPFARQQAFGSASNP